jgi:hypothetical protein
MSADRLAEALDQPWYHTIELAPGAVTSGVVDQRPAANRVLPATLAGLRCLDVGTFDGFWAFEMERRGAAEVVASDVASFDALDWSRPARARRADEAAGRGSASPWRPSCWAPACGGWRAGSASWTPRAWAAPSTSR